jgi:hypothetical protein
MAIANNGSNGLLVRYGIRRKLGSQLAFNWLAGRRSGSVTSGHYRLKVYTSACRTRVGIYLVIGMTGSTTCEG